MYYAFVLLVTSRRGRVNSVVYEYDEDGKRPRKENKWKHDALKYNTGFRTSAKWGVKFHRWVDGKVIKTNIVALKDLLDWQKSVAKHFSFEYFREYLFGVYGDKKHKGDLGLTLTFEGRFLSKVTLLISTEAELAEAVNLLKGIVLRRFIALKPLLAANFSGTGMSKLIDEALDDGNVSAAQVLRDAAEELG